MRIVKAGLAGALAGVAGALVMTAGRLTAQRLGLLDKPYHYKLEKRIERKLKVDHKTDSRQELIAGEALHWGIGATFGAVYGVVRSLFDLKPLPAGPLYGMAVYAVNIAGIGPALDLNRAPWDQEAFVVGRRMFWHVLYGAVTALAADEILRRME